MQSNALYWIKYVYEHIHIIPRLTQEYTCSLFSSPLTWSDLFHWQVILALISISFIIVYTVHLIVYLLKMLIIGKTYIVKEKTEINEIVDGKEKKKKKIEKKKIIKRGLIFDWGIFPFYNAILKLLETIKQETANGARQAFVWLITKLCIMGIIYLLWYYRYDIFELFPSIQKTIDKVEQTTSGQGGQSALINAIVTFFK